MIDTPLFEGEITRLAALDPERDAEVISRWTHDPAYLWQIDDTPARPLSTVQVKKQLEAMIKEAEKSHREFNFAIRTRDGDQLAGVARLFVQWSHGSAQFAIGIGLPEGWAQGYGDDALRLILRYAFAELNLYRLEVKIGEDCAQVIHALQRAAFTVEVRRRQSLYRNGKHVDLLHLGLSREEWQIWAKDEQRPTSDDQPTATAPGLFTGALVQLKAWEPEVGSDAIARWSLDSEFRRLDDSDPARPLLSKRLREEMEQEDIRDNAFAFAIHTLSDDRLIGFIGIDVTQWTHRDAYVGISIGERDDWGKGYGTDAMRVLLRFAFTELNLHRVSLTVFEYNPRAIRSYEKAGFVVEGRLRQWMNREGRRWDLIHMSILREEWERQQTTEHR